MTDEDLQRQIEEHRERARSFGDAALEAVERGDIGWARTAARQAAQYARMVIQLETGEKQTEPESQAEQTPRLNV
jgi:HEPN domain-containing protein